MAHQHNESCGHGCGHDHGDAAHGLFDEIAHMIIAGEFYEALAKIRRVDRKTLSSEQAGQLSGLEVAALAALGHDSARKDRYAEARGSRDHEFLLAFGSTLADLGLNEPAIETLEELCRLDSDSPVPALNLAETLRRDSQHERALLAVDDAIERDPQFAASYHIRADILSELDRLEESAAALRKCVALRPDSSESWMDLGRIESQLDHAAASDEAYAQSEKQGADKAELYYDWGLAAALRGDPTRLERCQRALSAAVPGDFRSAILRGHVAAGSADFDAANVCFRDAFQAACASEIEEADEHAAIVWLQFLQVRSLRNHAPAAVTEIFGRDLFSHEICALVRTINGRRSPKAQTFGVTIRGTVTDADLLQAYESAGVRGELQYEREYQVIADSPRDAERLALEIEGRFGGGANVEAISTEAIGKPEDDLIGVAWRSDMMPFTGENPGE